MTAMTEEKFEEKLKEAMKAQLDALNEVFQSKIDKQAKETNDLKAELDQMVRDEFSSVAGDDEDDVDERNPETCEKYVKRSKLHKKKSHKKVEVAQPARKVLMLEMRTNKCPNWKNKSNRKFNTSKW